MIYDCCIFYNELDMLEARLNILKGHVDAFVVCEANLTHSGDNKPLTFAENADRFREFNIIHVVADLSGYGDNWERERGHRRAIADGLRHAHSTDVVIVADVDEIPRPEILPKIGKGARLELDFYYYNVNTRVKQGWSIGALQWGNGFDPNVIRTLQNFTVPAIDHAGWHFSYFGGVERIQDKLKHFLHHDWVDQTPHVASEQHIANAIASGSDLWARNGLRLEHTNDLRKLPEWLVANRGQFEGWFA